MSGTDSTQNHAFGMSKITNHNKTPGLGEDSDVVLSLCSIDKRNCCATLESRRRSDECSVRGNPFMSRRLVEVIQTLRDYLVPEAHGGLSDEDVVHKVMTKSCARRWSIKRS